MSSYIAKDKEINLLFAESEKMYRNLVESVRNGIYMADANDILFFVNQSFVEILGYQNKEQVLGHNIAQSFYRHPEVREELFRQIEKSGFIRDQEVEMVRADGTVITVLATTNFIRNDRGIVIGIEGVVHDVTEKKVLEAKLQNEKVKLEEILGFDERVTSIRNLDRLVDFVVEKASAILQADKCSLMLFDETVGELCIKSAKGLETDVITQTRIKLGDSIAGRVAKEGEGMLVKNIEYDKRFERANSPSYRTRSFMSVPIKFNDRLIGVVNISEKNTGHEPFNETDLKVLSAIVRQAAAAIENAKLYRELEYLSVTDPLTNLWNYRCFINSVDEEIQRCKRFANTFSLLMIDADNFKSYNDSYGHLEGDLLLKEIGRIFTGQLRAIDKVCRYGGDEFVVLLPNTNIGQAKVAAEKLRVAVEKCAFKQKMTVSAGVAEYRANLSRFELIMRADRCLYQAKTQGRNRVFLHN
ncbi:MAG: diguanylate cyclase [Candidatus Omnitrophica bacterium]|nr:diguanylate cyclase [Candidatus Omnitrophota bacterium]